jgi:hypothetical protein
MNKACSFAGTDRIHEVRYDRYRMMLLSVERAQHRVEGGTSGGVFEKSRLVALILGRDPGSLAR